MLTVQKIRGTVQRIGQTYIPKAKARRFKCGVAALSLAAFDSLNAAGRSLGLNRFTGENRIRRLVTDTTLADRLQQLLVREALAARQGYWYCSLDHSQFGPFCIAVPVEAGWTGHSNLVSGQPERGGTHCAATTRVGTASCLVGCGRTESQARPGHGSLVRQ